MSRNRLKLSKTYLMGNMDHAPDGGAEWREWLTPWLWERGIIVLNPCDKPIRPGEPGHETDDMREQRSRFMASGDYDAVTSMMKPVRRIDLRMVDEMGFGICSLDLSQRPCGSYEEAFTGNRQRKPVIFRCVQGKAAMPPWMFSAFPHQFFHDTWDQVKEYIDQINDGDHINDFGRWHFFDIEPQVRKIMGVDRLERKIKRLEKERAHLLANQMKKED